MTETESITIEQGQCGLWTAFYDSDPWNQHVAETPEKALVYLIADRREKDRREIEMDPQHAQHYP